MPEFQDAVKKEASKLFADFKKELEEDAKKKQEADALAAENAAKEQEKALQEAAEAEKKKAAEVVDMTQPLYGNQDRKKEFNIRSLNPLAKLPDDKVVALKRTMYTTPSGEVKEDENLREIQFYNLLDFEAWSKTSEQNGLSVFQVIEPNLLVLHKPTGKK